MFTAVLYVTRANGHLAVGAFKHGIPTRDAAYNWGDTTKSRFSAEYWRPLTVGTIEDTKFAGHVGLEYEKDAEDPLPGIAESIGFIRGVTTALEG